jgi:hypothetical protein
MQTVVPCCAAFIEIEAACGLSAANRTVESNYPSSQCQLPKRAIVVSTRRTYPTMPTTRSPILIAALCLMAGTAATITPGNTTEGTGMTATEPLAQLTAIKIQDHMPVGYREAARRVVIVDGEQAELVRYERIDGRNASLGGEHFSVVAASNGRLKGFTRMSLDLTGGALPSREEAQGIAMEFLRDAAPDLLSVLKVSWIEPHDEPLAVARDGRTQKLKITGMKVKMQNTADGRWCWVIVGTDRKVAVFERDIVWVTFPGHRQTEKWLHDSWLAEKRYGASGL